MALPRALDRFFDLRTRNLVGASLWVIGARIFGIVIGFALAIAVARLFGKEALGFVTLLTSMTMLFGVLAEFGLGMYLMRDFSGRADRLEHSYLSDSFTRALLLVLGLAIAGVVLALPLIRPLVPEFASQRGALVLGLAALAFTARAVVNLNTQVLRGLGRIPAFSIMLVGPPVFNLSGVMALALLAGAFAPQALLPAVSYAVALCLVAAISTYVIRADIGTRKAGGRGADPAPTARQMMHGGLPFLTTTFMALAVSQGSVIVAGYFLSSADLGLYSVAVKIATLASFALASINMVAEPRFARLKESGDEAELKALALRTTTLVFWSTAPILGGILLLAPFMVRLAFGPDYLPAVPALLILTGGYFINSFAGVSNYFLNMTGGQSVLAWIVTGSALLVLVLSVLLIPPFGITGAAMAMGGAIAAWNLATLLAVRLRNGIWLCYLPLPAGSKGRQP